MNMFKPVGAKNIQEYLALLSAEDKSIILELDELIKSTVPDLKPHFAYNMLGYGSFPYHNYKKEIINWPVIALAKQKKYFSLYVCSLDQGEYLAEKYANKLGKVSVGKSCIRFKKLSDLNLSELKQLLYLAAKNPGLR